MINIWKLSKISENSGLVSCVDIVLYIGYISEGKEKQKSKPNCYLSKEEKQEKQEKQFLLLFFACSVPGTRGADTRRKPDSWYIPGDTSKCKYY